jgi:hypothetical protein
MNLVTNNFPAVLPENEITYFAHFKGVVDSVDELASVEITKRHKCYMFRIAPSTPAYSQPLLQSLLDFHNLLRIKLNLSKSIRKSSTIVFHINLIQ